MMLRVMTLVPLFRLPSFRAELVVLLNGLGQNEVIVFDLGRILSILMYILMSLGLGVFDLSNGVV